MRKYKKEQNDKAAQFVECLAGMAVEGPVFTTVDKAIGSWWFVSRQ